MNGSKLGIQFLPKQNYLRVTHKTKSVMFLIECQSKLIGIFINKCFKQRSKEFKALDKI